MLEISLMAVEVIQCSPYKTNTTGKMNSVLHKMGSFYSVVSKHHPKANAFNDLGAKE